MKKLLSLFTLVLVLATYTSAQDMKLNLYKAGQNNATEDADDKEGAKMTQTGTNPAEWDYGTIKKGSTGVRYFVIVNTGKTPLIISNAQGSCGCTVPSYPKEPIQPGKTAFIKVKYDTQRVGSFVKSVTLSTNATSGGTTMLTIKGTVEDAPASAPAPTTPTH